MLNLGVENCADVGPARIHLHCARRRNDFLGALGAGNKEHDLQDLPAPFHAEDFGHPGADPFKMLRGLDNPDESDTASDNGALSVALDKMFDVWDLMCDSYTSSNQDDSSVRIE